MVMTMPAVQEAGRISAVTRLSFIAALTAAFACWASWRGQSS
jgi:hypothetical protein